MLDDLSTRYARERYQDVIAAAAHDRLVPASGRPLALTRRVARPLGRALVSLGAWLMRYGKVERATTMQVYSPSARPAKPR